MTATPDDIVAEIALLRQDLRAGIAHLAMAINCVAHGTISLDLAHTYAQYVTGQPLRKADLRAILDQVAQNAQDAPGRPRTPSERQ